ncbi:MAG: hypothetical protein MZV63_26760 [Marinilabiliales bacterium]|nr:hypothetical protein [Marinilabiliales bacterium]
MLLHRVPHNRSRSADEQNDENTLMIHSIEMANIYLQGWAKRFEELGGTVFVGVDEITTNEKSLAIENAYIIDNRMVVVNLNSAFDNSLDLRIFSLDGKNIFADRIELHIGYNNLSLEVPQLKSSVYLLELSNNGDIIRLKLLKAN